MTLARFRNLALAATLAVTGAAAPAAFAQSSQASPRACFSLQNWRGWTSPSPDVIYIETAGRDIFRVDLLDNRQRLKSGGRFLIVDHRGSSNICSAIDLDLRLGDTNGFSTPLFPDRLTRLSDAEAAALPKGHRP